MEDRRYARFEKRKKSDAIFGLIAFALIAALVLLLVFKFVFRF